MNVFVDGFGLVPLIGGMAADIVGTGFGTGAFALTKGCGKFVERNEVGGTVCCGSLAGSLTGSLVGRTVGGLKSEKFSVGKAVFISVGMGLNAEMRLIGTSVCLTFGD